MKIDLPQITLVAVACIRVRETVKAIEKSCAGVNFGAVKLITNEEIRGDFFETVQIQKLDYEQYNRFIVFELHKYIDTDFALIVQDDGFVTGPYQWRGEFLDYDYIGAPWPLPTDDFSYRDPFGNLIRVGNGGFSLRSKKLLTLPTELGLEWRSYFGYFNEDGFFTCHNRHLFEKEGCIFAPLEVAKYFSHERQIPETEGIVPFGFHRKGYIHN
jgi:hypothetical protein